MYVPINPDVYSLAFNAASAGMTAHQRVNQSAVSTTYDTLSQVAGAFAQQMDTSWNSAAALTESEALGFNNLSTAFWANRIGQPTPADLNPLTWAPYVAALIAMVVSNDNYLAAQGITSPAWLAGGGGVFHPQPTAAGQVLTSVAAGPLPASVVWDLPGGLQITSFAKTHGTLFEVGGTDVSPQFNQTYNEAPTSGQIIYTQQPGSPLVLIAPFLTGTIVQTFTSAVNGATASFTLSVSNGLVTKTSTLTDTWALPFLSDITATGAVAANQAFLDTMRADQGAQLHTTRTGTYLTGQTVGAGQISSIAVPTALGVPTFKDINGFVVAPVFVGTVAGYTNPFGRVVSMDLYTVGGVGVGVVSWSVS